jgi:hypothetical protein
MRRRKASTEHVGVDESAADVEVLEVGAGTNGLLNSGELHFALRLVRALTVAADAQEDHGDQTQEEGDNQADLNEGHPGAVEALRDAIGGVDGIDFHVCMDFTIRMNFPRNSQKCKREIDVIRPVSFTFFTVLLTNPADT